MLYRQDSAYLEYTSRGLQHPLSEQAIRLGIGIGTLERRMKRKTKKVRYGKN